MELKIRNFRGCKEADIRLAPLALVTGGNAKGKSSIAGAASAVLSATPLPLGFRKGDASALVNATGAGRAVVELSTPDGSAVISYPEAQCRTSGTPRFSSAVAVGLDSLPTIGDAKYRASMMEKYLKPQDMDLRLADALYGEKPAVREYVVKTVQEIGWDGAWEKFKSAATTEKGGWKNITGGETWGSSKGETWEPRGWRPELSEANQKELETFIAKNTRALEEAIKSAGASDEKIAILEKQVGKFIPLEGLQEAVKGAEREVERVRDEQQRLPLAKDEGTPCPHCGQGVTVGRVGNTYTLTKAETITREEEKRRRMDLAKAEGAMAKAKDDLSVAQRALNDAVRGNQLAEEAKRELEKMRGWNEREKPANSIDWLRKAVEKDRADLYAIQAKEKASESHTKILTSLRIADVLSPDGVRAQALADELSGFNRHLAGLEVMTGGLWGRVELSPEFVPYYRGRHYALLSESEQWRVRVTLQVAMAQMDGSPALVIDRVDVLDADGRRGLFTMLIKAGIPALLLMTTANAAKYPPPDLKAMGCGLTYWIEDGVSCELQPKGAA